jgi:hypothetical protein
MLKVRQQPESAYARIRRNGAPRVGSKRNYEREKSCVHLARTISGKRHPGDSFFSDSDSVQFSP